MTIDLDSTYRRYGPMVLRRCRRLLRDEELAADAMQDTFVQLLQAQDRLDDQALSSLLFRIATNVCLNRLRSRRRHPEDGADDLLLRIASSTASEPRIFARFSLGALFSSDATSTTQTMAVLHLHDGLTLAEVAQEVGLSISGVRKRLRRLRGELRELEGAAL